MVQKIYSLVSTRTPGLCNFLDAPELEQFLGFKGDADERWQVVYRSYATLHFVFVVDGAESELGILDLIQVCMMSWSLVAYSMVTSNNRFLWNLLTELSKMFANLISFSILMRYVMKYFLRPKH